MSSTPQAIHGSIEWVFKIEYYRGFCRNQASNPALITGDWGSELELDIGTMSGVELDDSLAHLLILHPLFAILLHVQSDHHRRNRIPGLPCRIGVVET